jgi:hypothetical protein
MDNIKAVIIVSGSFTNSEQWCWASTIQLGADEKGTAVRPPVLWTLKPID